MSLYLWHSSSSSFYMGSFLVFMVIFLLYLFFSSEEEGGFSVFKAIELPFMGGGASCFGVGCMIVWFFLILNAQGSLGGSSSMFDSGGFVFFLSSVCVLGGMLDKVVCQSGTFFTSLLPSQSPSWLSVFIVIMEFFSSLVRLFTLGIRMLANLLVGQILLFLWISVFSSVFISLGNVNGFFLGMGGLVYFIFFVYMVCISVLFFVFSLAFCYESFVYLFQSYLYGCLIIFYSEEVQISDSSEY